jgi:hypothetical protein
VCIPRVLRVRALRLWCVYFGLVGVILEESWLLWLFWAGFFLACEWRGFLASPWVWDLVDLGQYQ